MDRNISDDDIKEVIEGQARKSLWIETLLMRSLKYLNRGQARKSLWIETDRKNQVAAIHAGSGS